MKKLLPILFLALLCSCKSKNPADFGILCISNQASVSIEGWFMMDNVVNPDVHHFQLEPGESYSESVPIGPYMIDVTRHVETYTNRGTGFSAIVRPYETSTVVVGDYN